jgi:hypothetical protein
MATKPEPKLFFLTGRLKWGGISPYWVKPDNEAEYQKEIERADFVVDNDLKTRRLDNSSTVTQDLQDLKDYLLEPYFRAAQKAKHFQNNYFRQQWILVAGTFLTVIVSTAVFVISPSANATSTTSPTATPPISSLTPAAEVTAEADAVQAATEEGAASSLPTPNEARIAGIFTAIVTFITTIVTYLSQAQRPQYNWYLWRTVTEELRRHYYFYLAHVPPYHTSDSAEVLEVNAVQIETQQEQPQQGEAAEIPPRGQHSEADIQALINLYRAKRVQAQNDFYEDRIAENKKNAFFVSMAGVVLIAMATLLSSINVVIGLPIIILLIALLPVLASLLVSFEKIYGWGRQISLYEDAQKRLKIDNTIPPAAGRKPSRPYHDVFMDFVSSVENTLKSEMNQWGQNVLRDGTNLTSLSAEEALDLALSKSNLNKAQVESVREAFKAK